MATPTSDLPVAVRRPVRTAFQFTVRATQRFLAIGGTDRAMSVGAHAFSAIIPLALVLHTLVAGRSGEQAGQRIIERFELTGAAADATRTLMTATSTQTGHLATFLGLVILLFSGVALMRALQRAYTAAWDLRPIGITGYLDGSAALAFLLVEIFLITRLAALLDDGLGQGVLSFVLRVVVGTGLWLLLQWLLLSRRIPWRALVPGAVLSALGMAVVSYASQLVMPHVLATDAARYGPIGVTFGLLTWFLVIALVLVVGAVVSAEAGGAPALARHGSSRDGSTPYAPVRGAGGD
jgi:membrane protein